MLKEMVAYNNLDRAILEGYALHIEVHICQGGLKVCGYVIALARLVVALEVTHERYLGGDVQEAWVCGKEVAMALQPQPYKAVALQREAVRT
jgi:hypothetical protein